MDFYQICTREVEKGPNKGKIELYPDFIVGRSKDLMIRGKSFYAIWDEEAGMWSTDEYDVQRLVDNDLREASKKLGGELIVKYMRSANNGVWYQFRKYLQNISDNHHQLDSNLTFADTEVKKSDYASKRLPYALKDGDHSAWDELVGTLYNVEERAKIEWLIGAILSGDSKKLQKFAVFYGAPATGKGTLLEIIEKLFEGYTTAFDAKALGSSGQQFATEIFKSNPLVAIQQDGDLSKIEDNARLNTIISHEKMEMNEKFKASYTARIYAFLLLGTNQPVKISDAKSGIIRRLIDIHPTGVRIPTNHYLTLLSKIDFELGAIAQHCLGVYRKMGRNYYSSYRPTEMMFQTDVFFNFIEHSFDVFHEQDGTTLKQAYAMYKEYCSETGIDRNVLPQYKFREELKNYFEEYKERAVVDGSQVRQRYIGFTASKFKAPVEDSEAPFTLVLEETTSLLDEFLKDSPAQGWDLDPFGDKRPEKRWKNVRTTLADIDTSDLHFVKVPLNHIVIDFDLKDENGNKSLERNLEAASVWPQTYGEISQGGNGVHLHYITEQDPEELASVFSDGIEVKTLLGDASLRRRFTKGNNIPVAVFPGRLPVKEKKVLSEKTRQTEKGLRKQIQDNLEKKVHPGTKPSIDFIKFLLDEAYDQGLEYDVTDMRSTLIAFANNSSNQPLQSMQVVMQMKFKGKEVTEPSEAPGSYGDDPVPVTDDRPVIYDVEVYPNLFMICWKYKGSDTKVRMINPNAAQVEEFVRGFKLVGFNCRRYDNHILYAAMLGYNNLSLFNLSQAIVSNERKHMFGEAYNLSYADLWEIASKKQTLKLWQIELGYPHIEMDLPWDKPVPEEMWPKVEEYCCNDVDSTEGVMDAIEQDFIARQMLAEISGLQINDTTQRHTAKIIFGNDRNPQRHFKYTDLSTQFPGYEFDRGKSSYRGEDPSEGGYVYTEPGIYENVAVLDVVSMHPTSLINLQAFGPEYTEKFRQLVETRVAIKNEDYDRAKTLMDGRFAPYLQNTANAEQLSYALKIIINIVYGMTSAKFENPFKDLRNRDNIVAKRGALFMIDLKNFVQERGFQVVHIKTDSIKIPNATEEIIRDVQLFGEKYGYDFEHEATYDKFCLTNKATYIARYGWHAKKPQKVGTWDAVATQFQHPYVFKTLFSGEELVEKDFFEVHSVAGAKMYLDFEKDIPNPLPESMTFVGRVGQFVPVESNGGLLYRVAEDEEGNTKNYAVSGTKGYEWVESSMFKQTKDHKVNMAYFHKLADDAVKAIEKFGSFEEFVK